MLGKGVRFSRQKDTEFIKEVRKRVRVYFDEKDISIHGNANMVVKTVFMISLYLTPYFLMILGVITNPWLIFLSWVIMGLGKSGIGLSIMHDENHGAYSKHKSVNNTLSYLMDFIGANGVNWRIQHNVLHHSFTNVHGQDEDIAPGPVLRLSPHEERKPFHRAHHIYAWFLYGLMTITWVTTRDFRQLFKYKKLGLTKSQSKTFMPLLIKLIFSKAFYYTYMLVIPIIFLPVSWGFVLLCFFVMHFITGVILGIIFQPAHVVPMADYPLPDDNGSMENNWAIHQLLTTANFAQDAGPFSWFIGGLNFQIEHHLFPNICHVHYQKLSEIVKSTAEEFNLPYHSQGSFMKALYNHGKMLKMLGKYDRPELTA